MDVRERRWLYVLIGVFLVFNVVTLSPLVPWQRWLLWSKPAPQRSYAIDIENYQFRLPAGGMEAKVGRVRRVRRHLAGRDLRLRRLSRRWHDGVPDAGAARLREPHHVEVR